MESNVRRGGGGETSGYQAVYAVLQIRFHANESSIAVLSLQDWEQL